MFLVLLDKLNLSRTYEQVRGIFEKAQKEGFRESRHGVDEPYLFCSAEIYDYLRLLFSRIGHPHCYNCGRSVEKQTVQQIVDAILKRPEGSRIQILAPVIRGRKGEYKEVFNQFRNGEYICTDCIL